jgi:hypothetical protein
MTTLLKENAMFRKKPAVTNPAYIAVKDRLGFTYYIPIPK